MAKLNSASINITFSQVIKNSETATALITDEFLGQLEAIVRELAGAGILVEIEEIEPGV